MNLSATALGITEHADHKITMTDSDKRKARLLGRNDLKERTKRFSKHGRDQPTVKGASTNAQTSRSCTPYESEADRVAELQLNERVRTKAESLALTGQNQVYRSGLHRVLFAFAFAVLFFPVPGTAQLGGRPEKSDFTISYT